MEKRLASYAADLWYGASKYPWGWIRPRVVEGRFADSDVGRIQRQFFDALLCIGFRRTRWQLVFPGQTAGIVKNIDGTRIPMEYHVRFYDDGAIHCERECHRFRMLHWTGERDTRVECGEEALAMVPALPTQVVKRVRQFFSEKPYSRLCERPA
jgi:hypothetical protein